MTEAATPTSNEHQAALWFSVFGGFVAWTLHLAVGVVIVYDGCALGISNIRLLVGATTAVLAVIALAATVSALRIWRATEHEHSDEPGIRNGRVHFMALLGVWFSGLSLLLIVMLAVPVVWLDPCNR